MAREVLRTPDARFEQLPEFPFAPRYVDVEGSLRMHYVDEGPKEGPVVLLMHGEPTWSFLYRKMIPIFVRSGIRAIAPDLIGFGRSDKPIARDAYTYANHVAWMKAWLDALDLRDVTLFGQDWGSLIGLRLAAENEARFSRIVIANGFLPTARQSTPRAFRAWRAFARYSPVFPIGRIVASGCVTKPSKAVRDAYDAPFPSDAHKVGARVFPALVPTDEHDPAVPANRAAWDVLGRWEKPFLTLFGKNDPILGAADKPLQAHIPGAKDQPHERFWGGHFVQEDRGDHLADAIVRWIGVVALLCLIGCSADDSPLLPGDATTADILPSDAHADPDVSYPDVIIGKPEPYKTQVALAYCTRMKNCCAGLSGAFDYNACIAAVTDNGWQNTNAGLGIPGISDRAHLTIDKASAQACIGGLVTMSCPTLSSFEVKNLVAACTKAVVGNQITGGDCVTSIECQPTDYCDFDVDGGPARCATLLDAGAACGQDHYENGLSSDECAYKSGPTPPQFCNYDTRPTKSGYFCASLRADGSSCRSDNECQSGLCVAIPDGGGPAVTCVGSSCVCHSVVDFGSHLCGLDKAPSDAGAD